MPVGGGTRRDGSAELGGHETPAGGQGSGPAAVARAPIESVIVGLGLVFAGIVGLLFIVHHVRGVLSSGGAPRAPTGTPNPRGYDG